MPNSPDLQHPKSSFLPLWLILAATSLLYLPGLGYSFVWDDQVLIATNPRIASWSNVPSYFQHHFWFNVSQTGSYYRPLVLLWMRVNFALFGPNAALWHASTLFLHLVCVALVFLLLRKTFAVPFSVAVGTSVFAFHPAHIESVTWIAGLSEPLMTIPVLGSILLFLRYRETRQTSFLAASIAAFAIGLLVKETAAITFLLILTYSVALDREEPVPAQVIRALRAAAWFVPVLMVYLLIRWQVLRPEYAPSVRPLKTAVLNLPTIGWFYLKHLLWPVHLSSIYDFELVRNGSLLISVLVILAITAIGIIAARRSSTLLIAWAWIVFPLALAIAGVTAFDPHDYVHDRYLYLPVLGLGILLASVLQRLEFGSLQVFGRPIAQAGATVLALGALAYATGSQLAPWTNNLTLFAHAVKVAPLNPMGYQHLAFEAYRRNNPDAAIALYKKSLALDPNDYHANFGLAVLLFRMENWQGADEYCARANQVDPFSNNACYQFQTVARMNLENWNSAEEPIRIAIAHWPKVAGQHLMLGRILVHEGLPVEAHQEFQQELAIDPNSSAARAELQQLQR